MEATPSPKRFRFKPSQTPIKATWGDFGNSQVSCSSQEITIVNKDDQLDTVTEDSKNVKIPQNMDTRPPEQKVFENEFLLERIFSHIPIEDLLKIQSVVCTKWYNVISRELYMPWKKSYHRLRMESVDTNQTKKLSTPPPAKKSKIGKSIFNSKFPCCMTVI